MWRKENLLTRKDSCEGGLTHIFYLGFIEGIIALTRRDDGYGNIPVYDGKYFV